MDPTSTAYRVQDQSQSQCQSQSQSQSQAPCFLRHTLSFLPGCTETGSGQSGCPWAPQLNHRPLYYGTMSGAGSLDCLVLYTTTCATDAAARGYSDLAMSLYCSFLTFSHSPSPSSLPLSHSLALFLLRSSGGGRCCCHTHPCLACLVSFRLSR